MPSSSRNGFRAWMLVSRVAWAVGIVAASLGPWHAGGLNARSNAAPSPVARTPWLAPSPLDDQSLDEGEVPAPLEAEGISQIHPSLSPSPFENINLTSGNLALIIPLLHLPGNGLIDLDVMLSLNTKHWEWRIGPGVVLEGAPGGPKVISADGTPHTLVGVGTNDPMSPEFWRYQVVTHLLQKPNGVTVQYGRCDATTRACLPLQESDPFGNVISYEYNDGPTARQHHPGA